MRGERHQLCIDSWVLKQHVLELDEPRTGGGLRSHRRENFNPEEYFFAGRRPPRVHQQYIGFAEDMMLILFLVCILATLVTVHRTTCYRQFQEARRNSPLRHLLPLASDRPPPYINRTDTDTVDALTDVVCSTPGPKRVSETPPPTYEEIYRNRVELPTTGSTVETVIEESTEESQQSETTTETNNIDEDEDESPQTVDAGNTENTEENSSLRTNEEPSSNELLQEDLLEEERQSLLADEGIATANVDLTANSIEEDRANDNNDLNYQDEVTSSRPIDISNVDETIKDATVDDVSNGGESVKETEDERISVEIKESSNTNPQENMIASSVEKEHTVI